MESSHHENNHKNPWPRPSRSKGRTMFIDPDQGLTFEQLTEKVWHRLTPEVQARIEALSQESGLSCNDVMKQCYDRLQDPIEGPALHARLEQEAERIWFPLGRDPRRESGP